jgi:mRNA interferase MazF
MGLVINQYEVYLVDLDPTKGHEIQKTRPCLVISPNEMNHAISTVIIAPMTTKSHPFPTRIELEFNKKTGWIVLDQIRTIDKTRLIKKKGKIEKKQIQQVKDILKEMLVD